MKSLKLNENYVTFSINILYSKLRVSNGLLERELMSQKISGRWYSIVVTIWYVRSQSEDRVLNHLHGS